MAQAFISYSRKDIDFVRRLATDLQNSGIDVWWDLSGIQGSDIWERKIEEGLNTSQYLIIVLTPDSLASRWVRREYLTADNKGLRIIPLALKPHGDVPLTLRDIQPIDAIHRNYEDVLCELLRVMGIQPRPASEKKPSGQSAEKQTPKKAAPPKTVPQNRDLTPPPAVKSKRTVGSNPMSMLERALQRPGKPAGQQTDTSLPKAGTPPAGSSKSILATFKSKITAMPRATAPKATTPSGPAQPTILTTREILKITVRGLAPDSYMACPVCGIEVKAKGLIRHYDKHEDPSANTGVAVQSSPLSLREQVKLMAKSSKPDAFIECPVCHLPVKAKSLVLHYDRNHL